MVAGIVIPDHFRVARAGDVVERVAGRKAVAVRFDKNVTSGRTQPLRVAVVTDDQVEHDVVLKPTGHPEMDLESMANEAGFDVHLQAMEFASSIQAAVHGDYQAYMIGW